MSEAINVWFAVFGSMLLLAGLFFGGMMLARWMEDRHGENAGVATMVVFLAATLATGITLAIVNGGGK